MGVLGFSKTAIAAALILLTVDIEAGTLHAAVLPDIERDEKGRSNSFLATLINDTDNLARNCRIEIASQHRLRLFYWTTDQTDNYPTGQPDVPADIWPRSAQSFRFELEAFARPMQTTGSIHPVFVCDGHPSAIQIVGVNDVNLARFDFSRLPDFTDEELAMLSVLSEKLAKSGFSDLSVLSESEIGLLKRLATMRE